MNDETTVDERADLAERLGALSLPELADVLRQALPLAARSDDVFESVLALTEFTRERSKPAEPWDVAHVAYVDLDRYESPLGNAAVARQRYWNEGDCERCHIRLCSTVKWARCPVCAGPSGLT
jgi:hypothetical protein